MAIDLTHLRPVTPVTAEDLLTTKRPLRDEVPIVLDSAAVDRLLRAEKAVNEARADPKYSVIGFEAAEAEHTEALAAAKAAVRVVVVQAVPRWRLKELIEVHPPTSEQREAYKTQLKRVGLPANMQLEYNTETFPPALISETLAEPELTLAQATDLWNSDAWSDGELRQLFEACQAINKLVK